MPSNIEFQKKFNKILERIENDLCYGWTFEMRTFTKMPLILQAQNFCHYKHYILPYIFEKIIKGGLQKKNLPSFSYPPLKSRKISLFNAIPSIVKIEAHSKLSEMLKHHVREIRIYAL